MDHLAVNLQASYLLRNREKKLGPTREGDTGHWAVDVELLTLWVGRQLHQRLSVKPVNHALGRSATSIRPRERQARPEPIRTKLSGYR